ncbi:MULTISPECIES: hypothetical protein [Pseudomonas]|jgi:hypothetical protein|uniref:Uncharacterized protein n=1 Tax=Pseudomonas frederiksbergensis TaxID=104087 RepID=A0A0B1Z4Q2_9PSED|nr:MULTISPECIES: hypothetical protein [Pseudomonas]KHK64397.1 hypothetical protein JZ00_11565 [Pseudomonas frederiksbergensis]KJH84536.1 hypothetical protein UG46_20540 [Pseudomonas fluorescens]MBI6620112.1 hypothetical protein [Pseudomonas corrugata]MBI6691015.1 hypothetical protein [Pseudomonas corrugata]WRV69534.1 hypothetical protein VQ575_05615 [Pseudomonas frederiksbergensis]
MARKAFETFEAVSAVVPKEGGGYYAAIATKAIGSAEKPRFNKVLEEQTFETAAKADEAAAVQLTHLQGVEEDGGLVW